ncbi:MAG: ATP-binding protein, partial [Clostridia bacterium]|nr:ATP-binding protein [Clostridia bacterium]
TNIVNYSKATHATVSYSIEGAKLHISFTDNGIPYNPLKAREPDTTLSAEEREIGGLGIFMVRKMTESMEYEYKDDKNVLTLVIALS